MSLGLLNHPCILWPLFLVGGIAGGLLTAVYSRRDDYRLTLPSDNVTLDIAGTWDLTVLKWSLRS
jgi:hypothetical protein